MKIIFLFPLTFINTAFRTSKLSATALIGLLDGLRFLIIIFDLLLTILPFHLLGLNGLTGDIAILFEFKFNIGPCTERL